MMKKQQKKPYEKPCMQHFLVEAEDPICSGSVDFNANSPHGGTGIDAQDVNTTFRDNNNFAADEAWDNQ